MKKWESFSKDELANIVASSVSYREVAMKIGYNPNGGSGITNIKEMIEYYDFNTEHFLGAGSNKGKFDYSRFRYGNTFRTSAALPALINLRHRQCENCGLTQWNNQPIPLEIHHIDGNHLNNELSNLQLLCSNCHALTNNFKGRNRQVDKIITDAQLIEALKKSTSVRQALLSLGLCGSGGNYSRAYDLIYKNNLSHLSRATTPTAEGDGSNP